VSRLERLLNLTAALLTADRPLRAAEIRERVPGYPEGDKHTFRRAFERDKEALREMGIPIELVDLASGSEASEQGYLIRREAYALRDPGLDPDEQAAVQLAIAAVQLDGLPGTEAMWKLGGAPAPGGADHPIAALPLQPQLATLFAAVAQRSRVRFGYRSEERQVEPYRLTFGRGRWYLDGFDLGRQAERQFRLDRIDGQVAVGEPGAFERRGGGTATDAPPWELGDEPAVEATVRIDRDQAPWALDRLGGATVVSDEPDGVLVRLTVTNRDAFRSFVLGFLEHAEVLEPPELRDDLVAWLRQVPQGTGRRAGKGRS
jgi:proteasome accessory factor B